MTVLLIAFAVMAVVACLCGRHASNAKAAEGECSAGAGEAAPASCNSCSGQSVSCMQECKMEAATRPIAYFDDEELDAFKGRTGNSYDDDEVEQFAEVLHTMRADEVADWLTSLTLRGVELPDALKDEAYMLAAE